MFSRQCHFNILRQNEIPYGVRSMGEVSGEQAVLVREFYVQELRNEGKDVNTTQLMNP